MGNNRVVNSKNIHYYFTDYIFSIKPETGVKKRVNTELDKSASFALSTTHICIEFAIYMGFKEIYLIGVDNDYSFGINNNHAVGMKVAPYMVKSWAPNMSYATKEYELYEEFSKSCGVKIYNATRGGKLEAFERCDIDGLFTGDKE
jgi:hypothetical protein